jgi:hypothetical protein
MLSFGKRGRLISPQSFLMAFIVNHKKQSEKK